nr:MAG TPA: hypothetical protein [Caudoviricetes sp.]
MPIWAYSKVIEASPCKMVLMGLSLKPISI